ncbi:MAG: hypothetical protein O9296_17400 [Novosphingobium sp.]|nr:hypothetical protein [Novosphingobium sp.]
MTDNLIPFPNLQRSNGLKAGADQVVDAISEWLQSGRALAGIVEGSSLDAATKLEVLECAKELTARILQLYLVVLVDGHQAEEIRTRVEAIVATLNKA